MPFCYLTTTIGVDSPLALITKKSITSYHPSRKIKVIIIVKDSGHIETQYPTRTQIEEQTGKMQLMDSHQIRQFYDQVRCNLEAIALKKTSEIANALGLLP